MLRLTIQTDWNCGLSTVQAPSLQGTNEGSPNLWLSLWLSLWLNSNSNSNDYNSFVVETKQVRSIKSRVGGGRSHSADHRCETQ